VDEKTRRSQKEEEIVDLEVVRVCVHDFLCLLSSVPWLTITTGTSSRSAAGV
jgi:hypothetical protein